MFDALTSVRPYKRRWTVEEAIRFMRAQSGKHFDPQLLDAFFSILPQALEVMTRFRDDAEPKHIRAQIQCNEAVQSMVQAPNGVAAGSPGQATAA